jgi:hypothetical protein
LIGGVGLPFASVAGARTRKRFWIMQALRKANRRREGKQMIHSTCKRFGPPHDTADTVTVRLQTTDNALRATTKQV